MDNQNKNARRKINMKLKTAILMLLVTVLSLSGIVTANAVTVSNDGEYALVLGTSFDEHEGCFDGEYVKLVRFNAAKGETKVKLSELTKGIVPFNGKNEFSHWETQKNEKAGEELPLTDFTGTGSFYTSTGEEIKYDKGLTLVAKFEGKALKDSGNYYVTLDAFAGTINGKAKEVLESRADAFKTIDLTGYIPVRAGYTFVGWDLNGAIVNSVDASAFAKDVVVNLTATYTKDAFDGEGIVLTLNANGGTIDGKAVNKYDYVGGGNSGTAMSLLPYVPVREGYTFNGWNTKSDGSGTMEKYIFWRIWDNNEETNKKFDKDTLVKEESGYELYKNVTLYASWTKASGEPENPGKDTVKELQSTGETKAKIEFATEVSKDYKLDIKSIEVKKELADKNVKFVADINVLDGNNNVVKISDTKMKIRIALPEDLKGYDKYKVVYIVNDEIKETLPAAVENGYIVFETNHLSQYGIVGTNTGNGTKSPQTGDNSNMFLWVALLFASGGVLTVLGVTDKRKEKGITK